MVKISVIVPVYNVETYLEECLDSILCQTFKDMEIICVNDGSTDSSGEILNQYAAKDKRIKVIHKPNEGYGCTMNRGLNLATGEYIGIVESDDFIEPEMYEDLYALAVEYDLDFVKGDHWYYTENEGKVLNPGLTNLCECNKVFTRYENMNKIIAPKAVWSGIYKREFLNRYSIRFLETPGASYQDASFWHKVAMTAERGYFTDTPYHNYRRDNVNASVKSKGKVYCLCHELEESKRFLEKNKFDKSVIYPYLVADKVRVYFWNLDRISEEWKQEFIRHMISELKDDMSGGYLDSTVMGERFYQKVILMMQYPEAYFYVNYLSEKKYNIANHDVINEELKEQTSVYIYGAGVVGNRLKEYLTTTIGISGTFLVSEKEASGCDVKWIEDDDVDTEAKIIISVRGLVKRCEMCQRAISRGFRDIYILEDELINRISVITSFSCE